MAQTSEAKTLRIVDAGRSLKMTNEKPLVFLPEDEIGG